MPGNGDMTQWKRLVLNAAVEKVFSGQTKLWEAKAKKESKELTKTIIQTDRRLKDAITKSKPEVSR